MNLDELELSVRAYNSLKRAGINSLEELQVMTDEELLRVRNLGQKCYMEVKEKLKEFSTEKWTWNRVKDDFWGHGTCESREEAIKEAKEYGYTDFYIGKCEDIPLRNDPDVDRILEELDEAYSEDSGCDDYIYDGVTDKEKEWLSDKLQDLMMSFMKESRLSQITTAFLQKNIFS